MPPTPIEDPLQWERRARELLRRVAIETSRARDLREALGHVLETVCAHTGWPVGHLLELDPTGEDLRSAGVWHLDDPDEYAIFQRITRGFVYSRGVGLPGRVLATGKPVWIRDVTQDAAFPRAKLATGVGVRAGFGFPVMSGNGVKAVLEFFSLEAVAPDEPLLEVMESLGHQLGHMHDRLEAEARLVGSELRFRSLAASATDAIVTVAANGAVVSWNPAAERMFEWPAAEIIGEPLEIVIPESLRDAHRAGLDRAATRAPSRVVGKTVELAGLRRSGKAFPLELSLGTWTSGNERFYTGILRDITHRKDAERQLREQAERLDQQYEQLAAKNTELVRQREELLESWRQMEQVFAALADALPGQELDGKYRLESKIGTGGHGVVYRATERATGATVAVKVFRPANGRLSPQNLVCFRREGTAATRMDHPSAVRVLDASVSSAGIPYLVMEHLEGCTLAQRLRAEGPMQAAVAVPLVCALAEGIAAAHEANLLHRDIKPDNIFLVTPDDTPKLLDFGIARLMDEADEGDRDTVTRAGQMLGTPAYMAPERFQGLPYDGRSDVYSLGVLLYEVLSGVRPIDTTTGTPWEIIRHHMAQEAPNRSAAIPDVPAELEQIAALALARDPADRPTARAFAEALACIPVAQLAAVRLPKRRNDRPPKLTRLPLPTFGLDE